MLLQPKSIRLIRKEPESPVIITNWAQNHSPRKITASQSAIKNFDANSKQESEVQSKITKITKKIIVLTNQVSPKSQENMKNPVNFKRSSSDSPNEVSIDTPPKKINMHLMPMQETELPTFKKNFSVNKPMVIIHAPKQIKDLKAASEDKQASHNEKSIIPLQSPVKSIGLKKDMVVEENGANNCIRSLLSDDRKKDVYSHLLENFRYIVTPKSWSVTDCIKEKDRYIVFYNTQVLSQNDVLIAVIQKSLIIDKQGIINYSVHGLPVDTTETILPKSLDDTKKLLSILHIFDKIQVCRGIGNDLDDCQSHDVARDNCNNLRHKRCSLILLRLQTCLICRETRNEILRKEILMG